VKACAPFNDDATTTVCRKSGNYKISYEMKVYSTYGGYYPCYEVKDDVCPEVSGVYIKVCRASVCQERTERVWRYFSFGDKYPLNKNGVGDVVGRPYKVGTDTITAQTLYVPDYGCSSDDSVHTAKVILRSKCEGGEDYVLT
jgi:hypothetical protein